MPDARRVAGVGVAATASYLPERWMCAAELAQVTGIPEIVIVERFGLRGKHLAAADEHVTDLARVAALQLLTEREFDPLDIDAVIYFGSTWKNYPVWQAAPRIAHELGCRRAFALELDYTSCGSPVALRVAGALAATDPHVRNVLLVGASCESRLLNYANMRSRFMFTFGDGATAALLSRDDDAGRILGTVMLTDGSLSLHVKVPAGGSATPASADTVALRQHCLDVEDGEQMSERLSEVSLNNFVQAAEQAAKRSGLGLGDIAFICPIHIKPSMHNAIIAALGFSADQAVYLDDTGHMSGVDNLLALDRLARSGRLRGGDLVLMLAAGTGYTWAATVLEWGRRTA
jgi:3-oxoacyl-[acyl-carrier-protein] synthase-3